MKLFAQILIIAICAYTASAISFGGIINATENAADNIINQIENILHGNSHQPSGPTADTCYADYNTQLSSVNDETVSQSQTCYTVAQSSVASFTENINSSLTDVNTLSQELQSQLAACAAESSIEDVFNCYVSSFDANLKNLDDLTIQSQLAVAYLTGYQSEVEITQSGCVSSVIMTSKANSTIALNTLESCLDSVNNAADSASNSNSNSKSGSSSSGSSSSSSGSSSGSSGTGSSATGSSGGQIQVQIS